MMKKFSVITPVDLRIPDLRQLCAVFGGEKTLRQISDELKAKYPHQCPKCEGKGFEVKRINTYPSGLPDSGWVDQMEDISYVCDICNGQGFTKERLIAKPIKVEYVPA